MRSQLQSVLTLLLCGLALTMPVSGAAAVAAKKQLSLQQALEIAHLENPQIAIGRARKAGAEGARVRSRQGFSPRLTLDAYYLRLDTSLLDNIPVLEPRFPPTFVERNFGPVDGNVVSVELVQPLINIGAWNARRQAGHGVDAAGLQLRRVEDEIEVAVVEAYFGARTAERQVGAERKGLATAQRALRQARAGFEQDLVAPVDVLSARTRVSEMQARLASAEAGVVAGHSMLRQLLGMDGSVELELTDPVPEPPRPESTAPLQARMLEDRSDLQALEERVSAAEYSVRRARAAYLPDLNFYARYDRVEGNDPLNFNETGWLVAVNLHWKLFAGFDQAGAIDEARAAEQETRARLQAVRNSAWAEAQIERANWVAEVYGWDRARSGVLDAEEALALTEARYAEGIDDITALLRAQAEELAARTREINARYQALVAERRFRLAIADDDPARVSR